MKKDISFYMVLLLALSALSIYFYRDSITLFPAYMHAWTQSDRYAIALAYLDNMNLFLPRTFNLMTTEGVTGVDLPWHEYIVAILMKISGNQSPAIFRIYTLLYSLVGYFFLFRITRLSGANRLAGLAVTLFAFSLPVVVYYQAGFVPSAPALSTVFIAYLFFLKYQRSENVKDLSLALLFFTAAALYRTPYNIFLFATLLQQALAALKSKKLNLKEGLGYFIAYAAIFGYHFYKSYLNATYGDFFLTELMPARSWEELTSILSQIKQNWLFQYFTSYHYLFLGLTTLALMVFLIRKGYCEKLKVVLSHQVMLTLGGGLLYSFLMLRQFPAHDYYFMDSLYPGLILLAVLGVSILSFEKKWLNLLSAVVLLVVLIPAMLQSKHIQEERYTFNFWDRGEIARRDFEGSAEFLDSLGIPHAARVLVLDAYSTNTPLILMKRRGYTVQNTTRENLQEGLEQNYDYVVVQDVFLPSDVIVNYPELMQHLHRIAGNGKIAVFEYFENPLANSLEDLLGIEEGAQTFELNFDSDSLSRWEHNLALTDTAFSEMGGVLRKSNEFGPLLKIAQSPYPQKLLFSARFINVEEQPFFEVVCTTMNEAGENIFYRSFPIDMKRLEPWQRYSCLFSLPKDLPEGSEIRCYIYNPSGAKVYMDDLEVTTYDY